MSVFFCSFVIVSGCVNPFAPGLDDGSDSSGDILTDQKTVDGLFRNFQYAYTFKDTTIYSDLLTDDFIFVYRDYDRSVDVSWGREEEMDVTYGLFSNTQRLDLIWNNIITNSLDSSKVVRSFNLTITFNPTDIIFIDGRVNLSLEKEDDARWRISRWVDESNFK